jgi:lysozyme
VKISDTGINLIKHFENLNDGDLKEIGLQPKKDCSGYYTVGWGHCLIKDNGTYCLNITDVERYFPEYLIIDELFAAELLKQDLLRFERNIDSLNLTLNQNQFDALVSFIFNCGFGNLQKSTLLKRIKNIVNTPTIEACFAMWNKSAGVTLRGLILRRSAEAKLYNTI